MNLSPENQKRLADLEHAKLELLREHDRLTSRLIARVHDTDGEANLAACTDEDLAELRSAIEVIRRNRENLKRMNKAIRDVASLRD